MAHHMKNPGDSLTRSADMRSSLTWRTVPFAQMTYDQQRAFLGLGYGPPRGYAGHKWRMLARAAQPAFARIAEGFRAMGDAMRPLAEQMERDRRAVPPYTHATYPKRGRR